MLENEKQEIETKKSSGNQSIPAAPPFRFSGLETRQPPHPIPTTPPPPPPYPLASNHYEAPHRETATQSQAIQGLPQTASDCLGLSRIASDCFGLPWIASDCLELPRIASNCLGLPQIASDCLELPRIASGCLGLSRIASGCLGLPRKSRQSEATQGNPRHWCKF
ncbi:hypothetical protein V9T40_004496 [Parthenolecanium corni]|uniref:Uncharacterized protein n=1 Tax=Parthenolecanium corni TaxID=536013 RepID=A0AAN9U3H5_9HEMI